MGERMGSGVVGSTICVGLDSKKRVGLATHCMPRSINCSPQCSSGGQPANSRSAGGHSSQHVVSFADSAWFGECGQRVVFVCLVLAATAFENVNRMFVEL